MLFTAVLSVLTYVMRKVVKRLEQKTKEDNAVQLGVQAILRDRLIQSYNHHMEKGFCAIHDRDNVLNMYKQYHNLGVNGVVDKLIDELMTLPIKERDI